MTAVPDSKKLIQTEEVDFRSAISESTMTKIAGSVNFIINNTADSIGDITQSMLTEAQFQSLKGATWVRMDGRNVSGSDYHALTARTNIPDLVTAGRFTRMAQSEDNLGVVEVNQMETHVHRQQWSSSFDGSLKSMSHVNGTSIDDSINITDLGVSNNNAPIDTQSAGAGAENRPNNIAVNYFIKINN